MDENADRVTNDKPRSNLCWLPRSERVSAPWKRQIVVVSVGRRWLWICTLHHIQSWDDKMVCLAAGDARINGIHGTACLAASWPGQGTHISPGAVVGE